MTGRNRLLPGLAAVALFVVMAVVFVTAPFGAAAGFPEGESLVMNLGYALFDLELGGIPAEGFLAAFLIIAIALDVAIDSAIFLAKREDGGRFETGFGGTDDESDAAPAGGAATAADGGASEGGDV
ncbi:NADH dehydrogenase subunit J2 [Halalkaliarchaeum sp. AArc-CO]|uniref:proton-conducting membrane transporter n=1 Tax=unclassified Halalkaliarchaeum TaxID=2678344 RepID=UPI00217E5CA0|nr:MULTISPECIES: proton-conducting membrane transporter [unclassified Halalkaliarchaeum]MDR5673786.1 proton-conducting membrane transporter [Halalkaliarchaeum sp. AArc-GB]UWG51002.1 NADH dehydrogenase subunit J2 [Halalkaliarchaeum sp. AArc-CO]